MTLMLITARYSPSTDFGTSDAKTAPRAGISLVADLSTQHNAQPSLLAAMPDPSGQTAIQPLSRARYFYLFRENREANTWMPLLRRLGSD